MEGKKLYKGQDAMLSGVCSGFADFFGIDETIVRVLWVILSIGSFGTGIIVYLILAFVIPNRPYGNHRDTYDAQSRTYENKE